MGLTKTKKRTKYSRAHGKNMGTAGTGCRKNKRKSGHKGGVGMSGTGKRADHKKTLITKLFGHTYFGKKGFTSRGTKRDTRGRINIGEVEAKLEVYERRGIAKKTKDGWEVNLEKYKILGTGNVTQKLVITALAASKTAIEKIETAKGSLILKVSDEEKLEASADEVSEDEAAKPKSKKKKE